MMTNNKFNKENLAKLQKDLNEVLNNFAKENGMESLKIGNVTYNDSEFTTKLVGKLEREEETISQEIDEKAHRMGLPIGMYGNVVEIQGKQMRVVDINTRAPKNPLVLEDENGNRYRGNKAMAMRFM